MFQSNQLGQISARSWAALILVGQPSLPLLGVSLFRSLFMLYLELFAAHPRGCTADKESFSLFFYPVFPPLFFFSTNRKDLLVLVLLIFDPDLKLGAPFHGKTQLLFGKPAQGMQFVKWWWHCYLFSWFLIYYNAVIRSAAQREWTHFPWHQAEEGIQSVFLSGIEGLQLLKDLLRPQMPSSWGCNRCQSFVAAGQVDVASVLKAGMWN